MASEVTESARPQAAAPDRRAEVLSAALLTFARFGYRKTSMEDVAKAARISRPGLYFLFDSKADLFRAAASSALEEDVADVQRILAESGRPLGERLLDAFDRWAGRYIGPLAADVATVIDANPGLMGDIVESAPRRFADLVTASIAGGDTRHQREKATPIAQTLISASIGIKHRAIDRADYRQRLRVAIELLLG